MFLLSLVAFLVNYTWVLSECFIHTDATVSISNEFIGDIHSEKIAFVFTKASYLYALFLSGNYS